MFSKARASKAQRVSESLKMASEYDANQSAVWNDIDVAFSRKQAHSDTQSMKDLYEHESSLVEDYVTAFKPVDRQVGMIFCIDGIAQGLELFDHPLTCAEQYRKLVRSYAIDARDTAGARTADAADDVTNDVAVSLLNSVTKAKVTCFPPIGEGEQLRIESVGVCGGGLEVCSRLVHLCAFQVASEGQTRGEFEDQMSSLAQRRRHYRH